MFENSDNLEEKRVLQSYLQSMEACSNFVLKTENPAEVTPIATEEITQKDTAIPREKGSKKFDLTDPDLPEGLVQKVFRRVS